MIRVIIVFCFSTLFIQIQAQNIKKVLFVGNSYTYYNDLPVTILKLASSKGDSLYQESSAGGGQRLRGHASAPNTYQSFKKTNWDYIVLQEQSQLSSFPISQVQKDVFPYAKKLCDSIHALQNCIKPVFFMTWGRENGDQANCGFYKPLCTYEGMQMELRKNYLTMANTNNAFASPVGMVWREIRRKWPNINLYDADESHPRPEGTYAAACTFYAVLYGKSPVGASYKGGLSTAIADSIQKAANFIVFDSLKTWNISRDTVTPSFSFTAKHDTVTFNYKGSTADSLYWDFGDGNSTRANSPTHIYGRSGTFNVTLIAFKGCKFIDTNKNVTVVDRLSSVKADFGFNVSFDTVQFGYSGTQADSIKWFFGNGKEDTGLAITHIYGKADTFNVMIKAYYNTSKDSVTKEVITTLRPAGIRDIQSNKESEFSVFPNPVEKMLLVKSEKHISKIEFLDFSGKLIKEDLHINENEYLINTTFLEPGIYLLRFTTSMGSTTQRILKL